MFYDCAGTDRRLEQVADLSETLKAALGDLYPIERELGSGGMATVYLAQDLKHQRQVAIKVMRPELAASLGTDRFLREIRISAQLNHPNILTLIDSGGVEGLLYYVMPYVEGESLRDRLEREKQLPIEDALQVAGEVADALGYAHSLGIVHRDIKPENILFQGGHALVADFGIARAVAAAGGEKLTETGMAVGTPAYMSPEQASGETESDGRTDVYSLGCVLYEMLVGDPPFSGSTPQVVLARKSLESVPPLRNVRDTVPAALDSAVRKALARLPADRYRTGHEFIDALANIDESDAAEASRGVPWWPRRPAHRVLVVAAAVLALSAAAVVVPRAVDTSLFGGAAAVGQLRSVAVLPFVNQTGDPENEYLSDGITETLIGQLAQVPGLERVISRASVFTYKGRDVDPTTVAQDLDVAVVVTGAMMRDGDQWSLSVAATDAARNQPLWSDTYELTLDELTVVPERLAREIPEAMNLDVPEAALGGPRVRATSDPEAQRLYLRAMHLMVQYTDEAMTQAVDYLEQALDRDPAHALAYSGLAQVYSMIALFALEPPSAVYPQAKRAAQRALRLDDQLAEAHMAMGIVHQWFEWDWEATERELRRAQQLSPRNPTVVAELGGFLAAMDRADEAIEVARRWRDLDPVSQSANTNVVWTHHVLGQYEQAAEEAQATLELFPNDAGTYRLLALTLSKLERADEAVAAGQRAELLGEVSPWALASGRPDLARRNLERMNALARERFIDPQYFAVIYAGMGDTERALQWLERAYDNRSPNLVCKCDNRTNFSNLVSDPRYQELRSRMNYPAE